MKRREQILRGAAEVFAARGVAKTSLENIAAEVGIKREAVYYYFKNRAEILIEIILPPSRTLLKGVELLLDGRGTAPDKLQAAIELHLSAFDPSYIEMSVALREDHLGLESADARELRLIWDAYSRAWERIIAEGQAEGSFRTDVNPRLSAYGLLGMLNWVARWYRTGGGFTIEEIAGDYSKIALGGIVSRQDARGREVLET